MAKTTKDNLTGDVLVGVHFSLETSGKLTGYFQEVSGLGSESEVVSNKSITSTGQMFERKIPGRLKWGDVTLKRGITANMDLYDWRKEVEQGNVDKARVSCTIRMHDQAFAVVAEWELDAAWPSKISGPSLKADSSEMGVEEITLVHEGIRRIK